jgi:hypothetical protein
VISDNASDEDYGSYVDALADPRVVYYRQPRPVPVSENWQQALSLATGDYVLMLGDDDALAPRFSDIVIPHLESDRPDLAYLAAYHYCYPGVVPDAPAGYFAAVISEFLRGDPEAFCLTRPYARELAASVLDFRHRFNYNAQHFVLKREFLQTFAPTGGIYQSPYPDFFAAVLIFFRARSILVLPRNSVVIGISPKSFGAYYFSSRQKEGYRFLDNEAIDPALREFVTQASRPGDMNNTNWLIAAETARRALPPGSLPEVNLQRYAAIQLNSLLRERYVRGIPLDATAEQGFRRAHDPRRGTGGRAVPRRQLPAGGYRRAQEHCGCASLVAAYGARARIRRRAASGHAGKLQGGVPAVWRHAGASDISGQCGPNHRRPPARARRSAAGCRAQNPAAGGNAGSAAAGSAA